jgi:hypothetical protein
MAGVGCKCTTALLPAACLHLFGVPRWRVETLVGVRNLRPSGPSPPNRPRSGIMAKMVPLCVGGVGDMMRRSHLGERHTHTYTLPLVGLANKLLVSAARGPRQSGIFASTTSAAPQRGPDARVVDRQDLPSQSVRHNSHVADSPSCSASNSDTANWSKKPLHLTIPTFLQPTPHLHPVRNIDLAHFSPCPPVCRLCHGSHPNKDSIATIMHMGL